MQNTIATRSERLEFILKSLVDATLELKHPEEEYIEIIKSDLVARGYAIVFENKDDQSDIYHLHIRRK